jgi:hypothetical protein
VAGLLRRLLGRSSGKRAAGADETGSPDPEPASEPEAGQRIDAARERLKASIPPPEEEPPSASEDAGP